MASPTAAPANAPMPAPIRVAALGSPTIRATRAPAPAPIAAPPSVPRSRGVSGPPAHPARSAGMSNTATAACAFIDRLLAAFELLIGVLPAFVVRLVLLEGAVGSGQDGKRTPRGLVSPVR